jgi:D-alanyl-D-alanine carboxypeptidase (penicillin-binding protein 5/6)
VANGELINSFSDAKSLFEWVFSIYTYKNVLSQKEIICEVEIKLSANKDYVGLVPDKDIDALLVQNTDVKTEILKVYTWYEDKLVAPIKQGQHLGDVVVSYDGDTLGTAKLLANSDVERSNVLYGLSRIDEIVSTRWFKASVIIFIILFSFYVAVAVIRSNRKAKKRFI